MSKIEPATIRGAVTDLAVIVSVTILGAMHILPAEAVIAVLSALGGARVASGKGPGGKPPTSALGALFAGAAAILAFKGLRS